MNIYEPYQLPSADTTQPFQIIVPADKGYNYLDPYIRTYPQSDVRYMGGGRIQVTPRGTSSPGVPSASGGGMTEDQIRALVEKYMTPKFTSNQDTGSLAAMYQQRQQPFNLGAMTTVRPQRQASGEWMYQRPVFQRPPVQPQVPQQPPVPGAGSGTAIPTPTMAGGLNIPNPYLAQLAQLLFGNSSWMKPKTDAAATTPTTGPVAGQF